MQSQMIKKQLEPLPTTVDPGTSHESRATTSGHSVFLAVEGVNDIQFLRRISRILNRHDSSSPDLGLLEQAGALVFIPVGGGDFQPWSERLVPIGWRQFHIMDHEAPPETFARHQAAMAVNCSRDCQAVVTRKRALENYLHQDAIREAFGVGIAFGDQDQVADIVARRLLSCDCTWNGLSSRARRRLRYRVKKCLNTTAADRMTAERLAERDPIGEVAGWLAIISQMAT